MAIRTALPTSPLGDSHVPSPSCGTQWPVFKDIDETAISSHQAFHCIAPKISPPLANARRWLVPLTRHRQQRCKACAHIVIITRPLLRCWLDGERSARGGNAGERENVEGRGRGATRRKHFFTNRFIMKFSSDAAFDDTHVTKGNTQNP